MLNKRFLGIIFLYAAAQIPATSHSFVRLSTNKYYLTAQAPSKTKECVLLQVHPAAQLKPNEDLFFNVEFYNKTEDKKQLKGSVQWIPGTSDITISYDDAQPDGDQKNSYEYRIVAYKLNMTEIQKILESYNIPLRGPEDIDHATVEIKKLSWLTQYELSKHRTQLKIPSIASFQELSDKQCSPDMAALPLNKNSKFILGNLAPTAMQKRALDPAEIIEDEAVSSALSAAFDH